MHVHICIHTQMWLKLLATSRDCIICPPSDLVHPPVASWSTYYLVYIMQILQKKLIISWATDRQAFNPDQHSCTNPTNRCTNLSDSTTYFMHCACILYTSYLEKSQHPQNASFFAFNFNILLFFLGHQKEILTCIQLMPQPS